MGLDSRHVILTPPSPLHFNTPSSGFCGFLLTLWNCQSSQWPGQALSLWRRGFKMVPTKQHGRRIWKRHNELEKKKKIPATWETKPGEGEKMSKKEKRAGGGTLVILLYSPANSESSEWTVGISSLERSDREKGRDKKKKVRARPKEGGRTREERVARGEGWRGEQLESLSSAPSRWIGLMNASECRGAAAGSIKAGNTAQI